jgi:uncharacterized membrane protein YjjB (DUF3815 family)
MDIEGATTLVQGIGALAGIALVVVGSFVSVAVGGLTLVALGTGAITAGFVAATLGSLAVGKYVQTGLQATAALGFCVVFAAQVADLGPVGVIAGAGLVGAAVLARKLLPDPDSSTA